MLQSLESARKVLGCYFLNDMEHNTIPTIQVLRFQHRGHASRRSLEISSFKNENSRSEVHNNKNERIQRKDNIR